MKWLRNRLEFLNERERAKIKEVILPRQAIEVSSKWGESYLELEEVTPTNKIKQGRWKLSDDDKFSVLEGFFNLSDGSLKKLMNWYKNLPEHFVKISNESIDRSRKSGFLNTDFDNFDIRNVILDQIYWFGSPIFSKISVSETKSNEYIVRDDNDVPMRDVNGIIKKEKKPGDVIWSKSSYSFSVFLSDYNKCFDPIVIIPEIENVMSKVRDHVKVLKDNDRAYKIFESIFDKDMYLSIKHNPKDILNMSVSKFYSSCQNLYDGSYRELLLSNIFDPNSIPAFLVFDTPIYMDGTTKISDHLPICRRMLRSIEQTGIGNSTDIIYFDRTYPDRLENLFGKIIERYSSNIQTEKNVYIYLFAPDLQDTGLDHPYMDRLDLDRVITIGKNVKEVFIKYSASWDRYLWPKKTDLEVLSIETECLPENFFSCEINCKKLEFKYMDIYNLDLFSNVSFQNLDFNRCNIPSEVMKKICGEKPKKISIVSSKLEGGFDGFEFEELELMYTIKSKDLIETLKGIKTNKLILSSDLLQSKENKEYINDLKKQGIKVEIKGPKI